MAKNICSNIDLNQNQLQNALLHPTGSAPSDAKEGQVWFDNTTGTKSLKVYNGTKWVNLQDTLASDEHKITIDGNSLSNISTWRGEWALNTQYYVGDIVKVTDSVSATTVTYICVFAHNSGTSFASNAWQVLGGGGTGGTVPEFALTAEDSSDVISIYGIKQTDGAIAKGTSKIDLAKVAKTGKAENVSVTAFTGMDATQVQSGLAEIYGDEAVTVTEVAGVTADTFLRKYTVQQIGIGDATTKTLDEDIEIPKLELTAKGSTTFAAQYILTYDGDDLSTTIDIPKDWLLKKAWAGEVTNYDPLAGAEADALLCDPSATAAPTTIYVATEDIAAGTTWETAKTKCTETYRDDSYPGEKCLCLNMNVKDATAEDELLVISLTDLGAVYLADDGIKLDGLTFKHINAITASDTTANHVFAGKLDAQGHVSAYDGANPVAQLKSTTGIIAAGDTSITLAVPTADASNAYLQYVSTRLEMNGSEVIADTSYSTTDKAVTVQLGNAMSADITVTLFYTIA